MKEVWGDEVTVLLCDFHRKQAWWRWISTKENGVPVFIKGDVFRALENIAVAPTAAVFNERVRAFKSGPPLSSLTELQKYFNREWLPCYELWARHERYVFHGDVNTNNYTEALNRKLKKQFLPRTLNNRVDSLLQVIEELMMPDFDRQYLLAQYKASDSCTVYQHRFPAELMQEARPFKVRLQLNQRIQAGKELAAQHFTPTVEGHVVHVKKSPQTLREQYKAAIEGKELDASQSYEQYIAQLDVKGPKLSYTVDTRMGTCTCLDWVHRRMPCKHMCAAVIVLGQKFMDLPASVRLAVHLVVDTADVEGFNGQLSTMNVGGVGEDDEDDLSSMDTAMGMEDMSMGEEAAEALASLPPPSERMATPSTDATSIEGSTAAVGGSTAAAGGSTAAAGGSTAAGGGSTAAAGGSTAAGGGSTVAARTTALEHVKHWQSLLYRAAPAGLSLFLGLVPSVEAALLTELASVSGGQHGVARGKPTSKRSFSSEPDKGVQNYPIHRPRGRPKGPQKRAFPDANDGKEGGIGKGKDKRQKR